MCSLPNFTRGLKLWGDADLTVKAYQNLFEGRLEVKGEDANFREIRVKVHPNGRFLQWAECTCREHRKERVFCHHLVAFLIHVGEQFQEFWAQLNLEGIQPDGQGANSWQHWGSEMASYLDLTKSLQFDEPGIEVDCVLAQRDIILRLDIDEAGSFLKERSLVDAGRLAEFGTLVHTHDHQILVEKALFVRCPDQEVAEKEQKYATTGRFLCHPRLEDLDRAYSVLCLPLAKFSLSLGSNWLFLPEAGYFELSDDFPKAGLPDLTCRTFQNDDAAQLILGKYSEVQDSPIVFIDHDIDRKRIVHTPQINDIGVLKRQGQMVYLDPSYGEGSSTFSMYDMIAWFRAKNSRYFPTKDGWVAIPDPVAGIDWELDHERKSLIANSSQVMILAQSSHLTKKSRLQFSQMLDAIKRDDKLPKFETTLNLRDYQLHGAKWLWWLRHNNMSGLLADDMGLGKTHQVMAFLDALHRYQSSERAGMNVLIVCPRTLIDHWCTKMTQYASHLNPSKYHGSGREIPSIRGRKFTTVVTSYALLIRDIAQLSVRSWDVIVLDEAHLAKNSTSQTFRAAQALTSKMRVCLTGTPIENNPKELKTIFDFLMPGYLPGMKVFNSAEDDNNRDEYQNALNQLKKTTQPFFLRRSKQDVMPELPPKIEDIRYYRLSEEQVDLYQKTIRIRDRLLEDNSYTAIHIFSLLQNLKQICDHPALVVPNASYDTHVSGKFEIFRDTVDEIVSTGSKIAVFSQYVSMIDIIAQDLKAKGISCVTLTGKTSNRAAVIKSFQDDPSIQVIACSLFVGGVGIDLTAADTVIHYDRWWNASKEDQATDRVHRFGQDKPVQIIKLVGIGTLEEKIDSLIAKKKHMTNQIVEDSALAKSLTKQELVELLTLNQ